MSETNVSWVGKQEKILRVGAMNFKSFLFKNELWTQNFNLG